MDERPPGTPQAARAPRRAARLAARTRELEWIEALARSAGQAREPAALFEAVVLELHRAVELDLAVVARADEGPLEVTAFLGRPVAEATVERLARRAARSLGYRAVERVERRELEDFAAAIPSERGCGERDLVTLPLEHAGRRVAALVLLPVARPREAGRRVLFAAANHASRQLGRILGARAEEARRLAAVLGSMPQAVIVTDAAGAVRQHNRAAAALFDALDLPLQPSVAPALERLGLAALLACVGDGEPMAQAHAETDAGRCFSVTVSPLARAEAAGRVIVISDVTESRRLQQRLAQSEKMSSLGQLISGTAHELNNPLTSVLGYAQLLRGSAAAADPEVARRLEILEREAERCRRIVQNLLSFARQRPAERRAISLQQIVDSVLGLLDYALRTANVRVVRELRSDLPMLHGDEHQLQQVLINLLTNARDALRGQPEPGVIHVRTDREGDRVVLEVRDNGPGVREALRQRIFEPFFTTKNEGTGLGLAIVEDIVSAHGGSLELATAAPRGAVFRVRLPLGRCEASLPVAPAAQACAARGRVLVVDDEPHLGAMVRELLEQDGHEVGLASGPDECLARLAAESWDVILADVHMPGMAADELHAEIGRRRPELARRVVLSTGDTVSDEPERLAARARLELVRKPFDLGELRALVRRRVVAVREG